MVVVLIRYGCIVSTSKQIHYILALTLVERQGNRQTEFAIAYRPVYCVYAGNEFNQG